MAKCELGWNRENEDSNSLKPSDAFLNAIRRQGPPKWRSLPAETRHRRQKHEIIQDHHEHTYIVKHIPQATLIVNNILKMGRKHVEKVYLKKSERFVGWVLQAVELKFPSPPVWTIKGVHSLRGEVQPTVLEVERQAVRDHWAKSSWSKAKPKHFILKNTSKIFQNIWNSSLKKNMKKHLTILNPTATGCLFPGSPAAPPCDAPGRDVGWFCSVGTSDNQPLRKLIRAFEVIHPSPW